MNTSAHKTLWFFTRVVIPVIVLFYLFAVNPLLSIAALAVWLLSVVYFKRAAFYSGLGKFHYAKGEVEKALVYFGKACSCGRVKPETRISYGYLLLKSGQLEKPEEIFNQLLKAGITHDQTLLAKSNLALVEWKKGRVEEAIGLLEEVIEEQKSSVTYGSLGYLLTVKGDLDKALELNLEAYAYNDANTVILDNLGWTWYLRGELEKAGEIYEKLMAKTPTFPEAYYNYGLVLLAKGDRKTALDYLIKTRQYKTSFLSAVSREEMEARIQEVEGMEGTDTLPTLIP